MTLAMLGLAGIPATAGFIGKFYLIDAAVSGGYTWLGDRDRDRLDDLARLLPAGDRRDVDARGARRASTRRAAVTGGHSARRPAGARGRLPRARRRADRRRRPQGDARTRTACSPRSLLVALLAGGATIFFGIIPQPLFELVQAPAGRSACSARPPRHPGALHGVAAERDPLSGDRRRRPPQRPPDAYSRPEASAACSASVSWRSTRSSPASQKPGSARSTPTIAPELLGAVRAACGEQLEIARHELRAELLVALVDRQREQLAVGVGVDVAGAADEVRDVGPPRAVALGQLDGVAEQLVLALGPQLAEALDRELALLAAARCARGPRSGSSRPGGRPSRSCPRGSRRAAPGARRARCPRRAAARRRSSRRTPRRSRRA